MNSYQSNILTDAEIFVNDIFFKQINHHFAFHNIDHTTDVVSAATKIADHYPLTNEDAFAVSLAA